MEAETGWRSCRHGNAKDSRQHQKAGDRHNRASEAFRESTACRHLDSDFLPLEPWPNASLLCQTTQSNHPLGHSSLRGLLARVFPDCGGPSTPEECFSQRVRHHFYAAHFLFKQQTNKQYFQSGKLGKCRIEKASFLWGFLKLLCWWAFWIARLAIGSVCFSNCLNPGIVCAYLHKAFFGKCPQIDFFWELPLTQIADTGRRLLWFSISLITRNHGILIVRNFLVEHLHFMVVENWCWVVKWPISQTCYVLLYLKKNIYIYI